MAIRPLTIRAVDAAVRAVERGDRPSAILRDGRVPGLALVVGKRKAHWQVEYKVPLPGGGWSSGKRLPLGDSADMSIEAAREAALAAKRQIAEGLDPVVVRKARRQANVEAGASQTVSAAIGRFVEERSPDWSAQTRIHYRADLKLISDDLGDAPMAMVERPALVAFIDGFLREQRKQGASGVRRAERLAHILGALWRQAGPGGSGRPGWGWPGVHPAVAGALPVPGRHRLVSRKRVLTENELVAAWPALRDGLPDVPVGRAPRLVLMISLATGLRIGAIALTRMADLCVNPEPIVGARDNGPWLRVPAEDGRKFSAQERREAAELVVPLSNLAVMLFREALALRRGSGLYVFEGHRGKPLSPNTVSRGWRKLADAEGSPIPSDTVAHDLRRTMRTHLGEAAHDGSYEDEERLIGHAVGSRVARVYDRGRRLARLRPLAELWGQRLEAIVSRPPAPVCMLPGSRLMTDYFVKSEIERLAAMVGEGAEPGDRNDRLRIELERLAATIEIRRLDWGEYLRRELDRLATLSPEHLQRSIVPGSWSGHVAGERRYSDDQDAGRIHWRAVGQRARLGQKALSEGNMELAECCMREAQALECAAYRARMKPADYKALGVGARPRGRKQASETDAMITAAVQAELPAAEDNIAKAIKEAKTKNPGLLDHLTESGVRKVLDRKKKRSRGVE